MFWNSVSAGTVPAPLGFVSWGIGGFTFLAVCVCVCTVYRNGDGNGRYGQTYRWYLVVTTCKDSCWECLQLVYLDVSLYNKNQPDIGPSDEPCLAYFTNNQIKSPKDGGFPAAGETHNNSDCQNPLPPSSRPAESAGSDLITRV